MNRRDKNNLVRRQRLGKEGKRRTLLDNIGLLAPALLFLSFVLFFLRLFFLHVLINMFGSQTSGVIIDEKNWVFGKHNKKLVFTYSYKFTVDGKVYKEDSKENKHEVGEEVGVEYLELCPSISRIKNNYSIHL